MDECGIPGRNDTPPLQILGRLYDALPLGIVVLDLEGRVLFYNRYEEALAGRVRQRVLGRMFFEEIAPCLNVRTLGQAYRAHAAAGDLSIRTEFSFDLPMLDRPRDVLLRLSTFDLDSERYGLLLVEDISAQRTVDRMKEMLSALVVHDLKNPLTALRMNLDMLAQAPPLHHDANLLAQVTRSIRSADRLSQMVGTLLETARLEANDIPLAYEVIDLCALARTTACDLAVLGQPRGVRLVAEVPENQVEVQADARLVLRALENLVENGLRHAHTGGLVRLQLSATSEDATLRVHDDGPGIPPADRERIFDKFVRVDSGAQTSPGHNFGLGLTLVRLVARAHGGYVRVTCPPEGGSIFQLSLPRVRPVLAHSRSRP